MKHLGQIVELMVHKASADLAIRLALIKTKSSIRILKIEFPEQLVKKAKRAK